MSLKDVFPTSSHDAAEACTRCLKMRSAGLRSVGIGMHGACWPIGAFNFGSCFCASL